MKYKDGTIEGLRMRSVKAKVIPVMGGGGAKGTISESYRQYLRDIPGKHEFKELQNTAKLGTEHITSNADNADVKTTKHST
jgi:hypothetical protein